jgi:acyl-CoA synthetase (AMP-forming)/AMP-acid ligase II
MSETSLLHGFFAHAARLHPERVAIDVPPSPDRPERRVVTYAELDARVDAFAAALAPGMPTCAM